MKIREALEGIQWLYTDTAPLIYDVEENLIYEAKDKIHGLHTWEVQESCSVPELLMPLDVSVLTFNRSTWRRRSAWLI